jgi:hypothetical protein
MNTDEDDYLTDEENDEGKQRKKTYSKKVSLSLLNLDQFKSWLLLDDRGKNPKCKVCNVSLKGGKSEMTRHSETKVHTRNISLLQKQPTVDKFVSLSDKLKQLETSMVAFLVENNLPISLIEPLNEFCKSLPDKNIVNQLSLAKQKATNIIRQGLRPYFNEQLINDLQQNFFSIFIDETSDINSKSLLGVVVSYFSVTENRTNVDVLDVVELNDWTAQGIYNSMMEVLMDNNIPLHNWVGFCADTTNVMMGQEKSVAQLIKQNFPSVIIIKCSCHSIHLVASYACKKLPNSLEDLVRNIYSHFKRSAKRTKDFEDFQKFYNEESNPKKMLAPGQTRWLSLQNCVKRILEYWESLTHYWQLVFVEDKTHGNELTFSTLKNPLLKCLVEFVDYALGLLRPLMTLIRISKLMNLIT